MTSASLFKDGNPQVLVGDKIIFTQGVTKNAMREVWEVVGIDQLALQVRLERITLGDLLYSTTTLNLSNRVDTYRFIRVQSRVKASEVGEDTQVFVPGHGLRRCGSLDFSAALLRRLDVFTLVQPEKIWIQLEVCLDRVCDSASLMEGIRRTAMAEGVTIRVYSVQVDPSNPASYLVRAYVKIDAGYDIRRLLTSPYITSSEHRHHGSNAPDLPEAVGLHGVTTEVRA